LGVGESALGGDDGEVVLNDCRVEAPGGDIDAGAGNGFGGEGAAGFALTEEGENLFVDLGLFVIDVHAVVGDEDAGGGAVAFGVDVLVEGADAGEAIGADLAGVFLGKEDGKAGGLDLAGVLAGAGEGVGERDDGLGLGGADEEEERQRSDPEGAHVDHFRQFTSGTFEAEDWLKGTVSRQANANRKGSDSEALGKPTEVVKKSMVRGAGVGYKVF
jgi:hypothetical protein